MTLWSSGTGYGNTDSDAAMARIAALGADWVTLVPTWHQPTRASSTLVPTVDTPSDASLTRAVVTARRLGLKVVLKPHLDVRDGTWRGAIRPADPEAWFDRYGEFVLHYASLAKAAEVEQVVVGTELAGVSGETARWRSLIAAVRAVHDGLLTYASLPFEVHGIHFWDALDFIGVNAYWPLATSPTDDPAILRRSWMPIVTELEALSRRWRRQILFTEAGYASQVGTATDPSSWTLSKTPSFREQAAAYEALISAFSSRSWFAGIHWWAWLASNQAEPLDFTPQDKPAELVLRDHWC